MSSKLKIQLLKAIWKLEIDIADVGYRKITMHMDIHVISYTQKQSTWEYTSCCHIILVVIEL